MILKWLTIFIGSYSFWRFCFDLFFSFVVIGYAPFVFVFLSKLLLIIYLLYFLLSSFANNPQLFRYCFVAVFFLLNLLLPSSLKVCLLRCHFPHKSFWLPFAALFLPRKNKCSNKTSLSLSHTHFSREFAIDFFPIYSNSTTILLYFPIQIRNKV